MIEAVRGFIKAYESKILIGLLAAFLLIGWFSRTVYDGYIANGKNLATIKHLESMLDAAQETNKTLSDMNAANASIITGLNLFIDDLHSELEKTYDKTPPINNICIAPDRVRILNKQRAKANSFRR